MANPAPRPVEKAFKPTRMKRMIREWPPIRLPHAFVIIRGAFGLDARDLAEGLDSPAQSGFEPSQGLRPRGKPPAWAIRETGAATHLCQK
jgi:hypothetical protein